jgi:hypothetical protein
MTDGNGSDGSQPLAQKKSFFRLTPVEWSIASFQDRKQASHASSARAGRSRERQSKWGGSTRWCTKTALVTAPFLLAFTLASETRPTG